jgi:hypothetical protein
VAFQPTARGGPRHFVTGNIRIVNTAKHLLSQDFREEVRNGGWMAAHLAEHSRLCMVDHDWLVWIAYQHGIKSISPSENTRDDEAFLVENQVCYHCPNCDVDLLI